MFSKQVKHIQFTCTCLFCCDFKPLNIYISNRDTNRVSWEHYFIRIIC